MVPGLKVERRPTGFLGMTFTSCDEGLYVDQAGYLQQFLRSLGDDLEVDVQPTPSKSKSGLFKELESRKLSGNERDKFLSYCMSLMYIATMTRFDILKEVVLVSMKLSDPSIADMRKLGRICAYSRGAVEYGLFFSSCPLDINVYCDASFDVHSGSYGHSGILIYPDEFSTPVAAKSKKQPIVARSSTEAEIYAAEDAATYLAWIVNLFDEIKIPIAKPKLKMDNNSAI